MLLRVRGIRIVVKRLLHHYCGIHGSIGVEVRTGRTDSKTKKDAKIKVGRTRTDSKTNLC